MLKRSDFLTCYSHGTRFYSSGFIVFVWETKTPDAVWRVGIATSRKVGGAVCRNRIKRLVREFFRLYQEEIKIPFDFVVVPKKHINGKSLDFYQVEAEFKPLLQRLFQKSDRTVKTRCV